MKVSGVTDALAAISKNIELAVKLSQLYRTDQKYQLFIKIVVSKQQYCKGVFQPIIPNGN